MNHHAIGGEAVLASTWRNGYGHVAFDRISPTDKARAASIGARFMFCRCPVNRFMFGDVLYIRQRFVLS